MTRSRAPRFNIEVPADLDLSQLSHAEKDALIKALFERLAATERRIAELEAKLGQPPKTPNNSSLPPSKGQKVNQRSKPRGGGPRQGSVGREGGGRLLAGDPDETVIARPLCCAHCRAALSEDDQSLHSRYDKIDLPTVRAVVTRVERYGGRCPCCGGLTVAPVAAVMCRLVELRWRCSNCRSRLVHFVVTSSRPPFSR